jgi:RNA 3'-terminal phosphate cyclase
VARAREAAQAAAAQHAAVIGYPPAGGGQVAAQVAAPQPHVIGQHVRREASNNEYAALFVALIGVFVALSAEGSLSASSASPAEQLSFLDACCPILV